jgi:protein-S-isoprenylcysteine O-methyltransferase Ste14
MFPFLAWLYAHLAKIEEREIEAQFGDEYRRWAKVTPAFFPRLSIGEDHGGPVSHF